MIIPVVSDTPQYRVVRAVFLRLLGIVYGVAFLSLLVQIDGLIGSEGILPVAQFFPAVEARLGFGAWMRFPSLLWFGHSDFFLHLLCGLGVVMAVLLVVGFAPRVVLAGLWITYLSLVVAGRDFLSFQWDMLLLECGFLAILFAPAQLQCQLIWRQGCSNVVLWMLRLLLFRLMFSSGVVKLCSGDSVWISLRALDYHYLTQPLPTWTSWYAHHLPSWVHTLSVGGMFAIELAVPFAIFGPRKLRLLGMILLVALQVLIGATGNYGFFNLLTVALCITLLDDEHLAFIKELRTMPSVSGFSWVGGMLLWPLTAVILALSLVQIAHAFRLRVEWPAAVVRVHELLMPFRIVNGYGLFAVMTTERREIVIEGSRDGRTWEPYEFSWKPGAPATAPRFAQPHMPRLDWQMWFAALRSYETTPWFKSFIGRLLQGSPAVRGLLAVEPFGSVPPAQIRALMYRYEFSDGRNSLVPENWWERKLIGLYSPPMSLR